MRGPGRRTLVGAWGAALRFVTVRGESGDGTEDHHQTLAGAAGRDRALWAAATLAEKKEFLSLLTETISIQPRRKTAVLRLSTNYLELKRNITGVGEKSVLPDYRGDTPMSSRVDAPADIVTPLTAWNPPTHRPSDLPYIVQKG